MRFFTTLPVEALSDDRLTGLDFRVLGAIALHDGMSGVKGNGGGAYARSATMATAAGTDVSNFSKSLSKLVRLGYVSREPQIMDKRRFTLRVVYPGAAAAGDKRGRQKVVGQPTNNLVGEADSENGGFLPSSGRHYIPLNGELHSDETGEKDSTEVARFGKRGGYQGWHWTLGVRAPFHQLPFGAQLAHIERNWKEAGYDADALSDKEGLAKLLWHIEDESSDNQIRGHAERLRYEIVPEVQW